MAVTTQPEERPATAPAAGQVSDADAAASEELQAQTAVEVRQAGKRFGHTWVVRDLNFDVEHGSIFGLFGPSGSGKTTTIRLMLGLFDLDEGEIRVLGTAPRRFRARTRARIGYMPQLFVLYPELSAGENLSLVASLYGMGWLRRRRRMRQVLDFVELWEHRRKVADELSGGMKRRLELAAALVHNPELLVVDEPTAGVDPILRSKFWDHFRELRDEGRTIFVTSQYVTEADYCDRVAVLGRGQIIATGTPESLRQQAFGGEVVDVVAEGGDRRLTDVLRDLEGVRKVQALSYDHLQLIVDEATAAIPRVMAVLTQSGVEVKQVEQYRPNFEDVFVQLVEQSDVESVE
jgi:ABC-2 type transport system ATP-binding protein